MSFTRNNISTVSMTSLPKRRCIPPLSPPSPHVARGELLDFLDSLTPSAASTTSVTGPSSTSLSVQSTPPFASENHFPLFPAAAPSLDAQVKPQHLLSDLLPSTFTSNGKGFDAGDISMPFDLSLPLFDTSAYPVFHPDLPLFDSTKPSASPTVPLGSGVDPAALDSTLDSPLAFSQDASPWSELLASPMFNLAVTNPGSTASSSSELALPSLEPPSSALFSPLPTPPAAPTQLRPLPPLPIRVSPSTAAVVSPSLIPVVGDDSSYPTLPVPPPLHRASTSDDSIMTTTSSSSASGLGGGGRPEPTGFRTTVPLLGPDAPIQSRNPLVSSATSRKRKTAGAERALAKKRATVVVADPVTTTTTTVAPLDPDDLPAEIVAQVERKRLQNTMSARKSRARKHAKLQELERENELLAEENRLLKDKLRSLGLEL
ncbi:hypothetical protein JCM11491_000300 [Sporobolomyces phaffii]